MTYNLANIRTRVARKLDDTNFDTATLNDFINDGQRDIFNSRRFVFMEREADVTTSVGSTALTGLPTDMQTPLSIKVYTPVGYATKLGYVEYEDIDQYMPNVSIAGNTPPSLWTVFNLTPVLVYQADGTYTLKLKYIKEPTELTADGDVPEVPVSFSELLVLAAFKRGLEFNDVYDQSQIIERQIYNMSNMLAERYKRQTGTPHIMKQPNRVRRIRSI